MLFSDCLRPLISSLKAVGKATRNGVLFEMLCHFSTPFQLLFKAVHINKTGKPVLYSALGSFIIYF